MGFQLTEWRRIFRSEA